jgi:hypothetical protein
MFRGPQFDAQVKHQIWADFNMLTPDDILALNGLGYDVSQPLQAHGIDYFAGTPKVGPPTFNFHCDT